RATGERAGRAGVAVIDRRLDEGVERPVGVPDAVRLTRAVRGPRRLLQVRLGSHPPHGALLRAGEPARAAAVRAALTAAVGAVVPVRYRASRVVRLNLYYF